MELSRTCQHLACEFSELVHLHLEASLIRPLLHWSGQNQNQVSVVISLMELINPPLICPLGCSAGVQSVNN